MGRNWSQTAKLLSKSYCMVALSLYGWDRTFQTDRTCTVLYGVLRYGTVITVKKAEVRRISTSLVHTHTHKRAQVHGVVADVISLGSVVEACVLANNAELALKVFNRALAQVCVCVCVCALCVCVCCACVCD